MGEKGNGLDTGLAAVTTATSGLVTDPSVVERVTTTTSETLVGVGRDALTSVKDKALDKGADATIDEARRRFRRREDDLAHGRVEAADEDGRDEDPPPPRG